MSFYFEFTAVNADAAAKIVGEETAPLAVKTFLMQALSGVAGPVFIKAQGHLCEGPGSYSVSNAVIEVKPLQHRTPKS